MSTKAPSKEISPKLHKTIDRLQSRIQQSPDYDVHQELKAIANRYPSFKNMATFNIRYIRVQDYDSAIQLLYLGGELLLKNGLGASGADISMVLIDAYNSAHLKPDSTSRGFRLCLAWNIDV